MFICTDCLDDGIQEIKVTRDTDTDYPITMLIKLKRYSTRIHMSDGDALQLVQELAPHIKRD